jgi:hypothetical protein
MANDIGFKPTGVNIHGLTALIRNLGKDCTPDQYIREFVKNAIEACQRTGLADRQILIDFNPDIHKKGGLYKLAFIDNGDGMTLSQMENLLNSISASGPAKNEHENYGVGAKIASLTRNHFGVHYESWKEGKGHSILIRYNPKFDIFGIQGYPDKDKKIHYSRMLTDVGKPPSIAIHGTRVTLFGMNLEHDTMTPPWGINDDKSMWLLNYLNRRFFRLPSGLDIQVRVGYDQDRNDPSAHYLSKVTGFEAVIAANAQEQGLMPLEDATIHWWILKPNAAITGVTGLINQDEVFDIQMDRSNRISHFGVMLGRDRVVILVEPKDAVQNISRTMLRKPDGSELSWNHWQAQFRANMPAPTLSFLESLLNQSIKASGAAEISQRLMRLKPLYEISGYQELRVAPSMRAKQEETSKFDESAGIGDPTSEGIDQLLPESSGPSEPTDSEAAPNLFPAVEWINQDQAKQLIGRAAEYQEHSNTILANQDFKGFTDLLKYFTERYTFTDETLPLVRHAILEDAEQALMEAVAGILSLRAAGGSWDWGQYQAAISKEALTAVVMVRYGSVQNIELKLLGKVAPKPA